MEPDHTPQRKIHLFHCDHRGLPLALFDENGKTAWRAGFDEWGNRLWEENPDNLQQLIRLPGQQWDEESGLCYNRHRYYDPAQGRYITQDPIGLRGGWNLYVYIRNPIQQIDPLGLKGIDGFGTGVGSYCQGIGSAENYLPQEDAEQVIHNAETMHNVYNPLGEYAHGLAVGSAVVGMAGLGIMTAPIEEKGAACIEDTVKSAINEGERDPKTLALTCVKSFINKGSPYFQGKMSDYLIESLSSYSQRQ